MAAPIIDVEAAEIVGCRMKATWGTCRVGVDLPAMTNSAWCCCGEGGE
jgi:hypothetical protein